MSDFSILALAKVIQTYFNNNENQAITIAQEALNRNEKAEPLYVFENFFHTPDILVFLLCNALIGLGKVDFAIDVYKAYGININPIDPNGKSNTILCLSKR